MKAQMKALQSATAQPGKVQVCPGLKRKQDDRAKESILHKGKVQEAAAAVTNDTFAQVKQ